VLPEIGPGSELVGDILDSYRDYSFDDFSGQGLAWILRLTAEFHKIYAENSSLEQIS
jgi:hypothetical protein